MAPSVGSLQEEGIDFDVTRDDALVISDREIAHSGGEYLDWDDPLIDFSDFLNPQMNDETVQYPFSLSSSSVRHSIPPTDQTAQLHQAISSPNVSIPTIPTSTVRYLIQRLSMKPRTQRIAKLILHTLKSYPLMNGHRCEQQKVKVVVVRLAFIQPYEDVNGEGLHSSKQVPFVSSRLDLSVSSFLRLLLWKLQTQCTSSHKRSHSSRTFFQNNFRLPWALLMIICTKLIQLVRGSMWLFSTSEDIKPEWIKGGRALWRSI